VPVGPSSPRRACRIIDDLGPRPGSSRPGRTRRARDRYRSGLDTPVVGNDGQACISYEDYAAAPDDEIENLRHLNRRFTAGS